MRILIAGGRDFSDYALLSETVRNYMATRSDSIEIVSGHAKGADTLGEKFAEENGYSVTVMKAEWEKYGKSAGVIRNREMLEYIRQTESVVFAFWDRKSRGTKNTIDTAIKMAIPVVVTYY